MDSEKRFDLIKSVGEEIITEEELRVLLQNNKHPVAYDGFEPSGLAHLPFGVFRPLLLKDLLKAGVHFKLFLADWHAMINNKMGGDLDKIKKVGEYFIEVWKAAGIEVGKNKVEIIWASDIMNIDYWGKVFRIGENTTVKRVRRALSIMGREESELRDAGQIFYPMMQVADIFQLDVDICQLGLDQRRANIMAREIAHKLGWKVPVAVHHHMLLGMQGSKQKDVKVSFEEAKECFKEVEKWSFNLGLALENPSLRSKFADNISQESKRLEEKIHDIKIVWKSRLNELKKMFESDPKSLNSTVTAELPSLINNIKKLHPLVVDATSKGNNILREEWCDWLKKYESVDILIRQDMINKFRMEQVENKEVDFSSKMSKSKPSSAIFVHDSKKEIDEKLKKAYCPPKEIANNPVLDYSKHILFRAFDTMKVDRPTKFGGPVDFSSYTELEGAYRKGDLHPLDLKNSVTDHLDQLIKPVREHFEKDAKAKKLLQQVKSFDVTR